ncbi:GNAT family N-acetyltransferase [bacterium]|nr:GNAT family N-acetyltransferase [bacterium]
MNNILFRPVKKNDLDEVFLLLQQMTKIDYSNRDKEKCWNLFSSCSSESLVGVYKDKVIAYGSLVLEYKIRGGISGHIEDIVVSDKVRYKKIGTKLIEELVNIGNKKGCYRITLFCKESLINFYSKNGFKVNNIAMKNFLNK